MKIGIFAHSIARCKSNDSTSWVDKIAKHYDANVQNYTTTMCSEERILFNLKKAKDLDLAIIFHAKPRYMFIPAWHRDVDTLDQDTITIKAGMDLKQILRQENIMSEQQLEAVSIEQLQYMLQDFYKIPDNAVYSVLQSLNHDEAAQLLDQGNICHEFKQFIAQHTDKVAYYSDLVQCLLLNKRFMFHVDLQNSRHQGAMVLIDQYLTAKQIPAVHCVLKHGVPDWFTFQSGVVDYELAGFQREHKNRNGISSNSISEQGNQLLFKKMVELIQAARSRVALR